MKQLVPFLKHWWFALSKREQHLMVAMGMVLILFVGYSGIWQPLTQNAQTTRSRLASEQALLSWVKNKADQIVSLRNRSGNTVNHDVPFNQMITTSSQQYGLKLIRIQPRESSYQIWFEPVSFNQLVKFIDYLQHQYGIRIEALDIEKTKQSGMVDVKRFQVSSGSLQ